MEFRLAFIVPALMAMVALPVRAAAGRCEESARPANFNADTAMEAIFCEYDRTYRGTLLPLPATKGWRVATPHLTSTYVESGVQKGVLVVQRQRMARASWS